MHEFEATAGGPGSRPGFALPVAIIAIVVLGVIITAGFFAASQEDRVAISNKLAAEAFIAAERGMHDVLGTHYRAQLEEIDIDSTAVIGPVFVTQSGVETSYTVTIRRMGTRLYYIESVGEVHSGGPLAGARRQIGTMVRTRTMEGEFDQALRVFGHVTIGGNTTVSGSDTIPAAWQDQCEPDTAMAPGIVLKDEDFITRRGAAHTILGDPDIEVVPDMEHDEFVVFGDMTFDDLAELALAFGKVYPDGENESSANPGPVGEVCDVDRRSNWGAPTNADHQCHLYFPLILAQGAGRVFNLAGNSVGQGILLVEGDLHMAGTSRFYGIVIVQGSFEIGSGTARVNGTVLAGNGGSLEPSDGSSVTGTPTVQYSRCAIDRAQLFNDALSRAFPLTERSWFDLTLTREGL